MALHRGASKVETDEEALEQINIELGTGTPEKKEVACHKLAMICDKLSEKILSLKVVNFEQYWIKLYFTQLFVIRLDYQ